MFVFGWTFIQPSCGNVARTLPILLSDFHFGILSFPIEESAIEAKPGGDKLRALAPFDHEHWICMQTYIEFWLQEVLGMKGLNI